MCAYAYVSINVFRQIKFCFVVLNIWHGEMRFLWWAVDWDTELREVIHGGRYLRLRCSVSGILEFWHEWGMWN